MRVFLCAGEASGDTYGANLIRELRALEPSVECEGLGGVRMQQAGMILREDLASRGIMGFVEVVRSLGFIRGVFRRTLDRLRESPPAALVLIDYPGFNLRLAERAQGLGIPVVYYISPQVWAWKKGRVNAIRRCVRKMLVILPFEKAIYDEAGVPCAYVGHPLLDHLEGIALAETYTQGLVIGLLPGSRAQEIERILPVMLEVARGIRAQHPAARFVAPCVDEARAGQIRGLAGDFPIETAPGGMYDVLHGARFCLVASGTATVETALFHVPMVVMYRTATPTYWLARWFVGRRLKAIAMVNILAGRHIVPEYIQHAARPARILVDALELIADTPRRKQMIAELQAIRAMLKTGASRAAAREVLAVAREAAHVG